MPRSHPSVTPALILACCSVLALSAPALADTARFEIKAEPLSIALKAFAQQAHMQLLYEYTIVRDLRGNPVSGVLEKHEALKELLRNTGLEPVFSSNAAATIRPIPADAPAAAPKPSDMRNPSGSSTRPPLLGGLKNQGSADRRTPQDITTSATKEENRPVLQEVLVTGTLIPGVRNVASPLTVFNRVDIDASGASTLQQFMQQQPFDWGGGASEQTIGELVGGGNSDNVSQGSGFNLRGLGNAATLVLINGHRIAPGNTDANFIDTSLLPLDAIERIEVEPAGASATYGADAVGGVVNLTLRQHFQGAQTSVRYGSVARGGTKEFQVGQLGGTDWASGSAVFGYEFYDRTPLFSSDRTFSMQEANPFYLLPEQVRQSAFASINQTLNDTSDIYATLLYGRRTWHDAEAFGASSANPIFTVSDGPNHTSVGEGVFGANVKVSPEDTIDISLLYSGSHTSVRSFFDSFLSAQQNNSYSVAALNAKLTGSVVDLADGPLRFAVGGEVRREELESDNLVAGTAFQPSRNILSGFVELNIPLVGQPSWSSMGPRVSLSAAGRIDRYSDFGTTINPNIGIIWQVVRPLKFRSTFGTSFVAPDLNDLNPVPSEVAAQSEQDPGTGALSNVLEVFGGNPDLHPETADVFTAGLDFNGMSEMGLRASVTYYHINFQHLIVSIQGAGVNVDNALALGGELGPEIIQRNPPLSEVFSLANTPGYTDLTGTPGGVNLNSIVAIIDSRQLNLSRLRTGGLDLSLSYARALSSGSLRLGFDGTYISQLEQQVTSGTPVYSPLNTPYNPVDFKARTSVTFLRGNWSVAAFLNYINSYQDNRAPPIVAVASWATVDLDFRYDLPYNRGVLKGSALALSVINLADRNPPFVSSPSPLFEPGLTFDGANANALGRFVSLQFTQEY